MSEIRGIVIVTNTENIKYVVGENGVSSIKDLSVEFEDAIYSIYEVYQVARDLDSDTVYDELMVRIENSPVVVEYK